MLTSDVLTALARNPRTGIIFNRQGQIVELLRLERHLTREDVCELARRHQGSALRFVAGGRYTPTDVAGWVRDALEGYELLEQDASHSGPDSISP